MIERKTCVCSRLGFMSEFQYIARGLTGQQVDGVLSAGSEQEALSILAGRSLFPLNLELAPETVAEQKETDAARPAEAPGDRLQPIGRPAARGRAPFAVAGIAGAQDAAFRPQEVLEAVRGDIAEGTRLAEAMRKHPKVFSELASAWSGPAKRGPSSRTCSSGSPTSPTTRKCSRAA